MKRSEAKRYRKHMNTAISTLTDEAALEVAELFLPWEKETPYVAGDRRTHVGLLYKCIQSHTSQADWTPDITPALWVRISVEEWPEWVQPTGAHDAYELGAQVSHNEKHWISNIPANIYEPGVYGWDEA